MAWGLDPCRPEQQRAARRRRRGHDGRGTNKRHRDGRKGLRVGLVAHLGCPDAVRRRAHGHAPCHWIFRAQRV